MSSYFIYYFEANIVCFIIFAIMLSRDLLNIDRQEKQIKYDQALVAFMLYFVTDVLWAAVIAGVIPKNRFTVLSTNFANYVLMFLITYTWLWYFLATEGASWRHSRRLRVYLMVPFGLVTAALIVTYLLAPQFLLDEELNPKLSYNVFQIAVPVLYIIWTAVYAVRLTLQEENPLNRRRHLLIGFFPLMVIAGGLLQVLVLPDTPVFCFCCALLMLVFYIGSMETQISTDPLTGLNNRGQLRRYVSQKSNLYREGRRTFVLLFDLNDFKLINDNYGHTEGDRALILIADSLRSVLGEHSAPMFLARYGGDEFVLIAHLGDESEAEALIAEIRDHITQTCRERETPYLLSVGVGCEELQRGEDSFAQCLQRADQKLYRDKAARKRAAIA